MKLDKKRRQLAEENVGIAYKKAHEWADKLRWDFDECLSMAYYGLCIAVKSYDPSKCKITTYAYKVIDNEFLMELKKNRAKKRTAEVVSMDALVTDSGESYANFYFGEEDTYHFENKDLIDSVVGALNEKEKTLVDLCFVQNKSQPEIAIELGQSQSYISRRLKTLEDRMNTVYERRCRIG